MASRVGQENRPDPPSDLGESTPIRKFADTVVENSKEHVIKKLQARNKLYKAKFRVKSKETVDLKTKVSILEAQKTVMQSELEDLKAQTATQSDLEDIRSMVNELASAIKVKPVASTKRKTKFLNESESKKYKPLTEYFTVVKGVNSTVKSDKEAEVKLEKDDVDVVDVESCSDEENGPSSKKKSGTKNTAAGNRTMPQPGKRRVFSYGEKEVVIKRIQEVLDADEDSDAADLITDLAENEFDDLDLKTLKNWWENREKILREIKRDPSLRTRSRLRR